MTKDLINSKLHHKVANDKKDKIGLRIDKLDVQIIELLIAGRDNKQISEVLKIPLSTIQRRVRNIMLSGIVTKRIQPNFKRLGIKKGLIHIYLSNGDIKQSTSKVAKMDGFLSASVHVGNSDIVGEFVYEDSEQLLDAISNIKHLDGVNRVLWSEEVFSVAVDPENILSSFKKIWSSNHYKSNGENNKNGKFTISSNKLY